MLIGSGGMGAVYRARQPGLDRQVALKVLPPGLAEDAAFEERFTREARALARLSHANIVAVHDFGQVGRVRSDPIDQVPGSEEDVLAKDRMDAVTTNRPLQPLYYFIMEYVDGTNLRELIRECKECKRTGIVPRSKLVIGSQAAEPAIRHLTCRHRIPAENHRESCRRNGQPLWS